MQHGGCFPNLEKIFKKTEKKKKKRVSTSFNKHSGSPKDKEQNF